MISQDSPKSSDFFGSRVADRFGVENVTQRFGSSIALEKISLTIKAGERVALVGPSGAGKTTLLRLLNGTIQPTEGNVQVGGVDLSKLSSSDLRSIRSQIGFVHQDLSLVPNVRVSQNIISGKLGQRSFFSSLRAWFLPGKEDLLRTHEILERVGIPEKLFQRTDSLSGGQQQRVGIARALFQEPRSILADEPVSSVDPARARDTVELLTDICREREVTLIMSLHNLELAREFFPRLVGIRNGKIAFDHGSDRVDDTCFHRLFDLKEDEMMNDGA
jgi:phosphonate transport system ATP-binding protein